MSPTARYPDFFIVGTPRGATTSLYQYLRQHPQIHMAPRKELNFFLRPWEASDGADAARLRDETDTYTALFSAAAPDSCVGEVSTGYLRDPEVPARIQAANPRARIIITLRDPVERAHSNYLSFKRAGYVQDGFMAELQKEVDAERDGTDPPHHFLVDGDYADHVARYIEVFGADRVLVLLFDHVQADAPQVLRDVFAFLGVDPLVATKVQTDIVHNFAGRPRNAIAAWALKSRVVARLAGVVFPLRFRLWVGNKVLRRREQKDPIDPAARDLLVSRYEPQIERLEGILGRQLPELRRSWPGY